MPGEHSADKSGILTSHARRARHLPSQLRRKHTRHLCTLLPIKHASWVCCTEVAARAGYGVAVAQDLGSIPHVLHPHSESAYIPGVTGPASTQTPMNSGTCKHAYPPKIPAILLLHTQPVSAQKCVKGHTAACACKSMRSHYLQSYTAFVDTCLSTHTATCRTHKMRLTAACAILLTPPCTPCFCCACR